MKEDILLFFLLSSFLFISACHGQKRSTTSINKEEGKMNLKHDSIAPPSDYDPYFKKTNNLTQTFGPTSITRNLLQDRNGDFWFATWEGILKYDGTTFTNFTNKEKLKRFHAFSILEDRKGNIWFGTIGGGVYFYDGKTFTNFTKEDGLANNNIGCFYEDKNGIIWIGTMAGLSRYDGKVFQSFRIEGISDNNDINSIIEDNDGKLWIASRGRTHIYDGKTFTQLPPIDGSSFFNIRSMVIDKDSNIWLGGNSGLWKYDGSTFQNFTKEFVGYVYEDSKGLIWTSSTFKNIPDSWVLTYYEKPLPPLNEILATSLEPEFGMLFGIIEDNDGKIWFGNLEGIGRYDGTTFEYFKNE